MNQKKFRFALKYWLPVVLWAAVIFVFSSLPSVKASELFWQEFLIKKTAHVIEYAILAILLYRGMKAGGIKKENSATIAVIIASLYGITDEIHQTFTPGREPRIRDAFFDSFGSIMAMLFVYYLLPKLPANFKNFAKNWGLL